MKPRAAFWGLLMLSCGPPSSREPALPSPAENATASDDRVAAATKAMNASLVYPSCDGAPGLAKSCGLISDRLLSGAAEFISKTCGEPVDVPPSEACRERFFAAARTEFLSRYELADAAAVKRRCEVASCPTIGAEELQWMAVHNDAAMAKGRKEIDRIAEEHPDAQTSRSAERDRRVAEDEAWRARIQAVVALQTMGQSPPTSSSPPSGVKGSPATAQTARAEKQCTEDDQCGPGKECWKLEFRTRGTCVTPVKKTGTKAFATLPPGAVGAGGSSKK